MIKINKKISIYGLIGLLVCLVIFVGFFASIPKKIVKFSASILGISGERTCSDSDGGRDYFVKGTSEGVPNPEHDFTQGVSYTKTYDSCIYLNNAYKLRELYCDENNYLNMEYVHCSKGCSNGVCLGEIVSQCEAGWKCKDEVNYGFQDNNCDWISLTMTECEAGCLDNSCYQQTLCEDTDEGKNYTTKGIVTIREKITGESIKYSDYCQIENPGTLTEFYCNDDGTLGKENYKCPIDCNNGVCVDKPVSWECTDSDGANNFYVKGETYGMSGGEIKNSVDYCIDNKTVIDYSCKEDGISVSVGSYQCPYGCTDGACICPNTVIDSDGGDNIYVKGTSIYYDLKDGECQKIVVSDECRGNDLWEVNGRSGGLRKCSYGCRDGACLREPLAGKCEGGLICNGFCYKGIHTACYDNKFYEEFKSAEYEPGRAKLCKDDTDCISPYSKCFNHQCNLDYPYYYLKVDIEVPESVPINTDFNVKVRVENTHSAQPLNLIIDHLLFYSFIQNPIVNVTGGANTPFEDPRNPKETSFTLQPGEKKSFEFIFNSQDKVTFVAGIYLWIHPPGYAGVFQSQPFIVYDPSMKTGICGNKTYNTQYALCFNNVLFPIGIHKCSSNDDCPTGNCYENYCVLGSTISRNRDFIPKGTYNVGYLLLYLTDDPDEEKQQKEHWGGMLKSSIQFANDWFSQEKFIHQITDLDLNFEVLNCDDLNYDDFLSLANSNEGKGAISLFNDVVNFCGIDRNKYKIVGIGWKWGKNQDPTPVVNALVKAGISFGASGIYYGEGFFTSTFTEGNFILHETMHAFGLPDLYMFFPNLETIRTVGSEYSLRDCYLMSGKAKKFWDPQHIPLCNLELYYLKESDSGEATSQIELKAKPSSIKLLRSTSSTKVYRILDNKKLWIPTAEIFTQAGYKWEDIEDVSETTVNQYPRVKLARITGDPKVYYLTEGGLKRWIPTVEVFNSYNNRWEDVVEISASELNAYPDNDLIRLENGVKVYKLENGKKRWIKTAEVFNRLGYDWNKIAPVNQTELDYYPEGIPIDFSNF